MPVEISRVPSSRDDSFDVLAEVSIGGLNLDQILDLLHSLRGKSRVSASGWEVSTTQGDLTHGRVRLSLFQAWQIIEIGKLFMRIQWHEQAGWVVEGDFKDLPVGYRHCENRWDSALILDTSETFNPPYGELSDWERISMAALFNELGIHLRG